MNTLLEALFEQYSVSEKDRYDIRQIFSLLPSDKQKNLIKSLPVLAGRLQKIENDLYQERDILM